MSALPAWNAVLSLRDVHAWYGESHVLHGVSFDVYPGEVVSILGRNGAGRTTTLRAILGLTSRRTGSVLVNGSEVIQLSTHQIAALGIGYCPEERAIFSSLSCEENLLLPPVHGRPRGTPIRLDEIYTMFPNLRERRASQGTQLSGGEQQMLAIARILRTGANVLLLDEPSEGLAPVIVQALKRLVRELKSKGFTVVIVEQNLKFAAPLADRFLVMEHGQVIDQFLQSELSSRRSQLEALLNI